MSINRNEQTGYLPTPLGRKKTEQLSPELLKKLMGFIRWAQQHPEASKKILDNSPQGGEPIKISPKTLELFKKHLQQRSEPTLGNMQPTQPDDPLSRKK